MALRMGGILAVVASVAVAAGGSVARAQSAPVIAACVKAQGQIRIVDASDVCVSGERRLEWPATAPAAGALRVLDANGTFVGRYASTGTVILSAGTDWISVPVTVEGTRPFQSGHTFYYNTPCPNLADKTVLHGTPGHLAFTTIDLVKFALGLPTAPNFLYYPGVEDPSFSAISLEYDESTFNGTQRVCYTFEQPLTGLRFAPVKTFDFSVFTPPFRIVQ